MCVWNALVNNSLSPSRVSSNNASDLVHSPAVDRDLFPPFLSVLGAKATMVTEQRRFFCVEEFRDYTHRTASVPP